MLQKTGRKIHESAAAHAQTLAALFGQYEVEKSDINTFIGRYGSVIRKENLLHQDSPATKVIEMNLDDDLGSRLKRELVIRSKIDSAISGLGAGTYFPLSTQFENSVLFLPSAQKFYKSNSSIVKQHFPEVETVVLNAFFVPKNKRPYGVHCAGSIGFQLAEQASKGFAYPVRQISFHCALTPTPLEKQPLAIFEDAIVESPNTSYLHDRIRSFELTSAEADMVDLAYYLHDSGKLKELDVVATRDFLVAKYWEKTYAASPDNGDGYYCDLVPGQAVVFDNYRPHGDSTFPLSIDDRVTIDLRCFSKVKYHSEKVTSGIDFFMGRKEEKIRQKQAAIECLLLIIGYESVEEFLKLVYADEHSKVNLFEVLTDLQYGVYNKTQYYLPDQNLDGHYEKCDELYDRIEREGEFRLPAKALAAMQKLGFA